jgi:23S rRNA pseudouridine1911/1915/1917 synthase
LTVLQEDDELTEDTGSEEEQPLYEHHNILIDKGQMTLRIDKFLMTRLSNATRTRIQAACEAGFVLVNDKPTKSSYKIRPGDRIRIMLATPPREVEVLPENIPVDIIFEDDYIAVVNKKPGMVVHPGYGNYTGTLVNALAYHFENLPSTRTKLNHDQFLDRPGLVHRIDKNTSGILIIAKTEVAMMKLARDFFDRNMDRRYLALCWGDVKEDQGTIVSNMGRDPKNRKMIITFPEGGEMGKLAITHYKVVERFAYVTLVECKLETGRTHQIRVHMKSIGHTLFNDPEYGGSQVLKGQNTGSYRQFVQNCFDLLPGQALHAKTLGIRHPITGEQLSFDSELPKGFHEVLEKWRGFRKE